MSRAPHRHSVEVKIGFPTPYQTRVARDRSEQISVGGGALITPSIFICQVACIEQNVVPVDMAQ